MAITNTAATNKTQITCDFPDLVSGAILATLKSRVVVNDDNEVFPGQQYQCTLDANGNVDSSTHSSGWFLPTYDTTGTVTYEWAFTGLDSNGDVVRRLGDAVYIGYDASAQALGSLLNGTTSTTATYANVSTSAYTWLTNEITATGATADGNLLQSDNTNSEDSGIAAADVSTAITNAAACELVIACSDETTALTTGTSKVTFRMPYAMTLTAVRSNVTTAPTGQTLVVDINESGTTILSTKLSIDAGETTSTTAATPAVISDSALADDAQITIDIDQVGSGTAGAGLKVALIGTRT